MYPPAVDLTFRFGEAQRNPTLFEMRRALNEVFEERTLGLPEGTLEEHPNSWLAYGYQYGDAWTVLTVDVYRGGQVSFSRYDDQDDSDPAYELWRTGVDLDQCLDAWQLLAQGDEQSLLTLFTPRNA